MSKKSKKTGRDTGIARSKFFLLFIFIVYEDYKFNYGASTIQSLPPFLQWLIEVGQYVLGIFVGKPFIKDLKEYISRQVGIHTNTDLTPLQKVEEQEALLKWSLLDLNMFYEDEIKRFREYLFKKGFTDIQVNVHPERKKVKEAEPTLPETPTA